MRAIADILPTVETQKDLVMIDGHLRRGRATIYGVKVGSNQMTCQDCGSTEGYTCRDGEHKVWFCATEKCLETDCELTKKRDRELRRVKF